MSIKVDNVLIATRKQAKREVRDVSDKLNHRKKCKKARFKIKLLIKYVPHSAVISVPVRTSIENTPDWSAVKVLERIIIQFNYLVQDK